MKKFLLLAGIVSLLLSCTSKPPSGSDPVLTAQDQKMEWWREARFGMFIHWGLYAQPAGEWKGEQIPGISEWIMARAKIPVAEYEKLAETFNPVKFNAEDWVLTAKRAGMKYIVITSKHHDGFAMFKSEASRYNIVDATPFRRDPLKELAAACEKHGMRLGFYYSQAQDWHEAGGTYWNIEEGEPHWDPDLVREPLMNYIEGKAIPQVKEILESYGGLDILWWDTPRGMTEEAAQALQDVADDYPEMITNNRLYRPWPGDFSTPEQHVPPTGLDYDWEVCMTMNTSWGYKHYDQNWKSSETLIRMLVDIASKGGNLLLNVGPTAEGVIPAPSMERLEAIGQWMDVNSESIYDTQASPFFKLPWGRCTKRKTEKGTQLFLHVFEWPGDLVLRVPGLKTRVKKVSLLADPDQKLNFRFDQDDLLIELPEACPDPINTVIVVETKGRLDIISNMPSLEDGLISLPADFADIHNPGYGTHMVLKGSGEEAAITNWVDDQAWVEWMFNTPSPGIYAVSAQMKSKDTCTIFIEVGEVTLETEINPTGGEFETMDLGEIEIYGPGDLVLALHPVRDQWKGVELKKVLLAQK
ncbi:MAG: alpha-L-fucosidase [Bacteroidota bacterium]